MTSGFLKLPLRIATDIILAVALIQGWWLVAVLAALFGSWYFHLYIEVILAGLVYDSLFGMVPGMGVKGYIATIAAVAIFLAAHILRRVVRR